MYVCHTYTTKAKEHNAADNLEGKINVQMMKQNQS
jgi:hypothetical protein